MMRSDAMNSEPNDTTTLPPPRSVRTHLGEIEYHDIGRGSVIMFVHLVLADATHRDKRVPLLADRFRCVIPTLPMGAHRTPADPEADLSVDGLASAVADLMDHLDVSDVTLVGNDSGGAISQVLAVNNPERLGRVVLTNCDMYDDFPPKLFG
jgi:pimeloyl-ACP methyl ester carboxylesterase